MGRSGPLDHPELLEVDKLLDIRDVGEAQRRLALLDNRIELSDGIAYLTTRLLHARGRLDLSGVADRLRELLTRSPHFAEAAALLLQAEQGPSRRAPLASEEAGPVRPAARTTPVAIEEAVAASPPPTIRSSPKAPRPASLEPPDFEGAPLTRPVEPPVATGHKSPRGRAFTPVSGFGDFSPVKAEASTSSPSLRARVPEIPKAPALPYFRDNSAPPSYAPRRAQSETDIFKGKSLLPQNAGRYSETPTSADIVEPMRRRSKPPRSMPAPSEQRRRATVPHTPERIRSAAPPKSPPALPTLFEIASWIDEGRFRDAVAAINRAGPSAGAEYSVLRARALAGAGYVDQAIDLLEQLDRAASLDPELRAACARLFIELGDPSRALQIAKHAFDADPERPLIRLTYALAAVRTFRRQPEDGLLDQAERALGKLAAHEGPLPALYQALKACIQAGAGDPQRAISIAQRALGLDPKSPDALAAIAEASVRLGRAHDAQEAWARLTEIAPAEGQAMADMVARAGAPATPRVAQPPADDSPLWTAVDVQLATGQRGDALRALERSADEAIRRMSKAVSKEDFTAIATVAASFLTTSPVLSSFAPYDASLWSVKRLSAALDVLSGRSPHPQLPISDTGLVVLLGSYLGETLRLAYLGRWEGRAADLDSSRVVVADRDFYPFRIISSRLHHGRHPPIEDSVGAARALPGDAAWRTRIANPVAPPAPWAPSAWPRPSQIGSIGRSLSQSPIGRYCEEIAGGALDRTTSSLIALDSYLGLVAPRGAPIDADAAWTRRVSVLAGGYLGETLRELLGGEWIYGVDSADDALGFRLKLRGTVEALPIAQVLERVIGERSSSLVDYARTLMKRAGRG